MDFINIIDTGLMMGLVFAGVVTSLGISFRLLNFPDLTVDGSFALGAAISATMIKNDYSIIIAIIVSLLAGGIAGIITSVLHTKLHVNKFLSGIIVVTALYSVLIRVMNGGNISFGTKSTFFDFVNRWDVPGGFSTGTILLLIFFALVIFSIAYLFLKSSYGIRLRAACLNPELAKLIDLNTTISLLVGLFFTNILSALSGVLYSLKNSYADIGFLQGILIISLASLTIGEKIVDVKKISRITYILLASIFGSILYQVIWSIALKFNLEASDLNIITAVIVILLFFWNRNKNVTNLELQ